MKRLGRIAGIVVTGLFLLSSCISKEPVEFNKIDHIKIRNISKESIEVEIGAILRNPHNLNFSIRKADIDLSINNSSLGRLKLAEPVKIKKRSENNYDFTVKATYTDLLVGGVSSIVSMIFKQKVQCRCKGTMTIRSMGITRTIPVEYDGEVNLRK
jgi:LEA14-like dessication related protein